MPNGKLTVEEFLGDSEVKIVEPKGMTFEEFSGGENIKTIEPETEEEKLSFVQRVGEDLQKRTKMAEEISAATLSGEQSWAEGILQIAGKVGVGGLFDLVGEGIVSAFRATPDFIEKPIRNAGTALLETKIGKAGLEAIGKGVEIYNDWKSENPRAARNLEAVVDIGLLLAPIKPKTPARPTAIGRAGERLIVSGEEAAKARKISSIEELVRPKPTTAVREAEVARTTEVGKILKRKEIKPSISEKAIADEVAKIPEISTSKTLQGNYNAIAEANAKLAKQLEADIVKNDFIYPKKQLVSALNEAKVRLGENPLIVGDAEKVAEKLLTKFEQIIAENEGKGSGILKARKEFDAWVKSQKGTNIFDPKNENALSIALREIRQTANNFLDANAKNVAVKESLKRQSNLFRAMENITPKAADEASNAVLRAWQRVAQVLSVKSGIVQSLALVAGLGGLGAAAVFAPFVRNLLFGLGAVYLTRRIVLAPKTRKFLGSLLKAADSAIIKTKDANIIAELRADRALILEILESASED